MRAWCIVSSSPSTIPGMSQGKPTGGRCVHFDAKNLFKLYRKFEGPRVCIAYSAAKEPYRFFCHESLKLIV